MLDFSTLTDRQLEVYEFIREKIESRGYGPTVREIGDAFGISSPNGVMCHLRALEKKGLIRREGRHARAIQLVNHRRPSTAIPLLGKVAAGRPTLAIEEDDILEVEELLGGPDHFALQVRGESMIEDHIKHGDYVIIRRQQTANNGERVVCLIDGEATLKKYYRRRDQVRLEPANGSMEPILLDDTTDAIILGVLVGVVRRC
jgi:repressor LexA